MKNLFIEYPKCSTCQKAKKWLDENKIEYVDRNIVTETPTKEELKKWITKSGLDVRKFFNTSGMKYRELNIKEKIKDMSEDEIYELLASDGMLIKRPLFISDTLILKSPTTTDMDRKAVLELSKICDENYEEYGYQMLKAGSSIAGMSVEDVIYQDFKS